MEKKLTRRRFLGKAAAAAAGLGVLGLGAQCGATPTPEIIEKVIKETVVVTPVPELTGEAHFWSMLNEGEPFQIYHSETIELYNALKRGPTVVPKWAGRQVNEQLRVAILAGDIPEISEGSDAWIINQIVKEGLTLPFDPYLEETNCEGDAKWGDTFRKGLLDLERVDGKVMVLPHTLMTSGFFYNVAMFEENKINIPETWDQFLEVCEALKKLGVAPIASDGTESGYNGWYFTWFCIRKGGPDKLLQAGLDKTGEAWDDPAFLEAAEIEEDFLKRGYFQEGYEGSTWPSAQVDWVQGRAAMIFCGSWLPAEMAPQMPEGFTTDYFPFPTIEGGAGNKVAEIWCNGYDLLKGAKNTPAAIDLLKFMTSRARQTTLPMYKAFSSINGTAVPSEQKGVAKTIDAAEKLTRQKAGLIAENLEWLDTILHVEHDRLYWGEVGAKAFIENLKKASIDYWSKKE